MSFDYGNLKPNEWRRVLHKELALDTQGKSNLELARHPIVTEAFIEYLAEPLRSIVLRHKHGQWPWTDDLMDAYKINDAGRRILARMKAIYEANTQRGHTEWRVPKDITEPKVTMGFTE